MKIMLMAVMFLSVSVAFAGPFNEVECSGVPNWIHFKLRLDYHEGTYHGDGTENYANLKFDCKESAASKTIVCESRSPFNGEPVTAIITIDKDHILTAKYNGIYSNHRDIKIGCIAGM